MTVIQFVLLGLGSGALYALAALGMVLIYRASAVINFAQGAVGMAGTYLFWILHDEHNSGFVAAAIPALLLCGIIGLAIQLLVMYPLRKSSPLSRILATLGVLALLEGIVALYYHQQVYVVQSSLPTGVIRIGSLLVGEDRLLILLLVLVLAGLLAIVYRRTRFGLATTAVAESPRIASHFGYSPNVIAAANWALGSVLAGLAGILLAPIIGLSTTGLTELVVPALAAALAGSMVSFPLTIGAGLAIGVAQSLITRYVSSATWAGLESAVPFILVLVILTLRGSALPKRGDSALRLPAVGTGRIRPLSLVVALVAGFLIIELVPIAWTDALTVTLLSALILLSVVVATGYAGQVSLAQVALAGCGAFAAGKFTASAHFPFIVSVILGALVAVPIGIVVGLPALRTRGANLAIVTLAMSVAIEALLFDNLSLTGGDSGIVVGSPSLFGYPIDDITQPRRYAVVALVAFTICACAVANLRRGKTGRRLLAVRSNERAAASLAIGVTGAKLYAFALSGVFAALGGILIAYQQPAIVFSNFQSFDSVGYVANSVIGGVGMLLGPLFGASLTVGGLGTQVGNLFGAGIQPYLTAASGAILILILIMDPQGVAASMATRVARIRSILRKMAKRPVVDESEDLILKTRHSGPPAVHLRVEPRELAIESLTVRFGNVDAVSELSFVLQPGEVLGLIGPNGAGKTTLIDAVTGFVTPSAGRIRYNGEDITRWSPRRRSARGIGRSFQSLELFDDMTVLENVLIASEPFSVRRYCTDLLWPGKPVLSDAARAAIDRFSLAEDLHRRPDVLPYGRRRLVAIARAIAADPSVLLLDEAAAGLNRDERDNLSSLIRQLATDIGIGVILVEHDVDLVMRTSDRVLALDFGRKIAEGTPDIVRADPRVISSYLGEEETGDRANTRDGEFVDGQMTIKPGGLS